MSGLQRPDQQVHSAIPQPTILLSGHQYPDDFISNLSMIVTLSTIAVLIVIHRFIALPTVHLQEKVACLRYDEIIRRLDENRVLLLHKKAEGPCRREFSLLFNVYPFCTTIYATVINTLLSAG